MEPRHIIPEERLPPGFAVGLERSADPPHPPANPAATVVLLRDTRAGPESFLLRRNRSSGFVPGAYVFPGGRVDPGDADPALVAHALALPAEPDAGYWLAAVRETFEETGVLLAEFAGGRPDAAALVHWRDALLEDRATLADALAALGARADLTGVVHFAHWITPLAEPRRFDTRFFAAACPAGTEAAPDAREMSAALWIRPGEALDRFRAGQLPMVFPTVHTLETLAAYDSVEHALAELRSRTVRPIMPRLVRAPGGIGIVIDEEKADE